jgi:uncharacterized protein (TIGR03437 family)
VRYYNYPGAPLVTSNPVVPGAMTPCDRQYCNFWVEQADAYGGWIGNAVDLMRYINALEGRRGAATLNNASLASIVQRPSVTPTGEYVGLTWRITPITGGQHWWHSGGASGTRNLLTRRQNNRNWVVLMNMRPEDEDTILTDLFRAFADAESRVTTWPTHDLFADFAGAQLATDPASLSFPYVQGAAELPAVQTVQVSATPAAAVNFTIAQPAQRWLRLDRLAGTTPASLRVSVDPAGLEPGNYDGTFTITAPQTANGTRTVNVTLRVAAASALTGIFSGASLEPVQEAAPFSRLIAEAPVELARQPVVAVAGIEAAVVDWSARRVEFLVPEGTPFGEVEVSILPAANAPKLTGRMQIVEIAPVLFVPRLRGPRAAVVRSLEPEAAVEEIFECTSEGCNPLPIDLGTEADEASATGPMLRIPVTGIRAQPAVEAYAVTIGEAEAPVLSVTRGEDGAGLDWITVRIPRELAGRGEAGVAITVGEKTSNTFKIMIR